jgi:hypothetical protein
VEDRDRRLRGPEFFWSEKYPLITFKSTKVIANQDSSRFQVGGVDQGGVMLGDDVEIVLSVVALAEPASAKPSKTNAKP